MANATYSADPVFRLGMIREFYDNLLDSRSYMDYDYTLEIYDINGSAVIVDGGKVNIISSDGDRLAAAKNSLEQRLRCTLTENNHTETE